MRTHICNTLIGVNQLIFSDKLGIPEWKLYIKKCIIVLEFYFGHVIEINVSVMLDFVREM